MAKRIVGRGVVACRTRCTCYVCVLERASRRAEPARYASREEQHAAERLIAEGTASEAALARRRGLE